MIENPNKRIVNFMFVNPFPVKLNEFSKRLRKLFDNKLTEYVTSTEERINEYIAKIRNDEFDEDEPDQTPYPLTYTDTPHLTIDITSVKMLALATADDPFFKLPPQHKKYFPELVIYNKNGEIIETIDEQKLNVETITNGTFEPECRDLKLKLNDDRRVSINLLKQKEVQMILLVIKSKDLYQQANLNADQFDRAQFRLLDASTNQTLDTALIKDMKITMPTPPEGEGEEEAQPEPEVDEGEGDDKGPQTQNVIVVGRVFMENGRWIYEQYNYMFKQDKYPDFFQSIGKIESESRDYCSNAEAKIKEEENILKDSKEAAIQAAATKAANKKKNKKGDKKRKNEDKNKIEEKVEDDKEAEELDEGVDIDYMPGFKSVLDGVHTTIFGPVNLELKEGKWNKEKTEELIKKKMKKELGNKINN